MRPKSAMYYTKEMNEIATEAVEAIKENLDEDNCFEVNNICRKFALESISYIVLGCRLEAFKDSADAKRLLEIADESGPLIQQLVFTPISILPYVPFYKKFVKYVFGFKGSYFDCCK